MTADRVTRPGADGVVLQDPWRRRWLRFSDPASIHVAYELADVVPLLETIEAAVERDGVTAAGFVSYEAAAAFDSALVTHPPDGFPLAWFGL